jgi:hypothetical protein
VKDARRYWVPLNTKYVLEENSNFLLMKSKIQLQHFFETLSPRFNAKNLEEIEKNLDASVICDRKNQTLYLDQEQYLTTVLNRFRIIVEKNQSKKILTADYELLRPADEKDK